MLERGQRMERGSRYRGRPNPAASSHSGLHRACCLAARQGDGGGTAKGWTSVLCQEAPHDEVAPYAIVSNPDPD